MGDLVIMSSHQDWSIHHLIEAAEAGGRVLRRHFGHVLDLIEKRSIGDYQTRADTKSERAVLAVLQEHFSQHNIYSEETGTLEKGSRWTLVVDPLDGSHNFVTGIPNFTVSVALLEGENVVAGVVHAPMIRQTYHAQLGKGAFYDGKKLAVSSVRDPKRMTVSQIMGWLGSLEDEIAVHAALMRKDVLRVLNNWSPAFDFCLLASGKIEAIVNNGSDLYDFAAGKLIAREAGAVTTDLDGNPDADKNATFLCSNNWDTHKLLLMCLQGTSTKHE